MNEHWRYFQTLEEDLLSCSRYVHFAEKNFDTYSTEFSRIIFAAASEFDAVAKRLCAAIDPELEGQGSDIGRYRETITSEYPGFCELELEVSLNERLELQPWKRWGTDPEGEEPHPEWWRSYNDLKHERVRHIEKATLGTALKSTAGLLVGLMYWFRRSDNQEKAYEPPKLFSPKSYSIVTGTGERWVYTLPRDDERRMATMSGSGE
jgi:hypothetical protein